MSIYAINPNLPTTTKLSLLNQMILELSGKVVSGKFDKNELDVLYSSLAGSRKYSRNVVIGGTVSTYTGWSHLKAESGYSIWKYTPTSYTYNILNQLYFDGLVYENRGSASNESSSTFSKVWLYNGDSGSGYVDNTTEAGTETGTQFAVMNTYNDYMYIGASSTFAGVKFEWQTRGSNYTLKLEYYNGSTWVQMSSTVDALSDATSNFQSDGQITWTIPSNWASVSVNSSSQYYVRISSTTNPITVAYAYYMIPTTSVVGLLALSSAEVLSESWAWCSYNGSIYATIRNIGVSTGEGSYYITSSSTATNLKNFFVYNHQFTLDHETSLYNHVKEVTGTYTVLSTDYIILAVSGGSYTITLPSAHAVEGREYVIKKMYSGSTVTIDGASGNRIDGATTKTLTTQYTFYRIASDGNNWIIIGGGSL
jgi:hypothetical protein